MGKAGSKHDPTDAYFTEHEYARLAELFRIDRNNLESVHGDTFRTIWGHYMVPSLMETWIQYFIRNELRYNLKVSFDLQRLSLLYKGQTSPFMDIKSQSIMRVILGTSASDRTFSVSYARVYEYFRDVIISFMKCVEVINQSNYVKWREIGCTNHEINRSQLIYQVLSSLRATAGKVSDSDLEVWLREETFADDALGSLLDLSLSFNTEQEDGRSVIPFPLSNKRTFMDIAHVLFLNSHLTSSLQKNWLLAYSTITDGLNFTRFSNKVRNIGPTLFIIKDTEGYVFGCYAPESWRVAGGFYGDGRCFVFRLVPSILFCEASGYNTNFMYHSFNQTTIPNGFGIGGQIGYWGLWLGEDMVKGRCETFCSTFKNYRGLSKRVEFLIDKIEVWAVDGTFVINKEDAERTADTILNKDPTAKALLEMTNIKQGDLLG